MENFTPNMKESLSKKRVSIRKKFDICGEVKQSVLGTEGEDTTVTQEGRKGRELSARGLLCRAYISVLGEWVPCCQMWRHHTPLSTSKKQLSEVFFFLSHSTHKTVQWIK
jgi:hypothetical protein